MFQWEFRDLSISIAATEAMQEYDYSDYEAGCSKAYACF